MPSAEQEDEPLPHILDVLCFEQFERSQYPTIVTPSSGNLTVITPVWRKSEDNFEDKVHHCRGNVSEDRSITPAKRKAGDDYKDEVLRYRVNVSDDGFITPAKRKAGGDYIYDVPHYRINFSDDFDLFDGELLRATDDEVLANAAMKKWTNLNVER